MRKLRPRRLDEPPDPNSLPPAEARRRVPPPGAPDPRGRRARTPSQLPRRGWRDVLLRVKREVKDDNLSLLAAGVAFYFMLSIFPGLLATVSIWGLVADPLEIEQQIRVMLRLLPREAALLLGDQLHEIASRDAAGLGFSAVASIGLALWSASKGAKAVIAGINVAYDEAEKRNAVRVQAMALLLTVGFVFFVALSLTLIAVLPTVLERLPLGELGRVAAGGLTWVLLLALVLVALAAVYRYAPSRNEPRWRWVSVGSLTAALLWLGASALFSWYAAHFGSFNETYGTLAGAILLILWLQITAFVVLLGAELNAEAEHQTAADTTEGPPRPMGEREATMADTLGGAYGPEPVHRPAARGASDVYGKGRGNGRGDGRGNGHAPLPAPVDSGRSPRPLSAPLVVALAVGGAAWALVRPQQRER
jgi:membrane protein